MRLATLLCLLTLLAAAPARAGLTVCNHGMHPARVALGLFNGRDWMSRGWWKIAAGKCAEVIAGPLNARFYYVYGTDTASGVWDGGTSFCTAATETFAIVGRADCAARGYDRRHFFQIDTEDNLNKVQTLQ